MNRTCYTCTHFTELIDDYQCWLGGEPVQISIEDDCSEWEEQ